ncbi:MAG TPA: hypothetical protein ENI87_01930 [bacterium]|nr:hypothetical protein [bacterium]
MSREARIVCSHVVLAAFLCQPAGAQAGPPTLVPKRAAVMRAVVTGIDEMLASWRQLRIAPLIEAYGLVDRVLAMAPGSSAYERARLLRQEALRCGVELDGYQLGNVIGSIAGDLFGTFDATDYRQIERRMLQWRTDDGRRRTARITVSSCVPPVMGRWAKHFEDEIAWWRRSGWFEVRDDVKVDGLTATALLIPQAKREEMQFGSSRAHWFLQLPGAFVDVSGPMEIVGDFARIEMAPPALPPGVVYDVNMRALVDVENPGGVERLLLTAIDDLHFGVHFEGNMVREEVAVQLAAPGDEPGLGDALLAASGPLPAQALPAGALVQVRARVAVDELFDWCERSDLVQFFIPPGMQEQARAALDGSIAVAVCAPPPGGVIPRVYLTCGLADVEAFEALVGQYKARGMPCRQTVYGDVNCTSVDLASEGVPQGIRPTFCVVGEQLHIAESPLSMKAFLRAQETGAEAMPVADAVAPAGVPGKRLDTLDLRFDPAAAYRTFYQVWFPLLMLSMAGSGIELTRDDLPDPDDLAEYVVPVRPVFFHEGRRIGMHAVGALGGLLGHVYGMMIPVMAGTIGPRHQPLHGPVASFKLRQMEVALERFSTREGRMPRDLVELLLAEKLSPATLLMPGDEHAMSLRLPDGRTIETSFGYFAKPVTVEQFGAEYSTRMLEIAPGNGRHLLDTRGDVQGLWGELAERPFESFRSK